MKATDALIEDLKLWACSPRVPLKAQIVMIEAIGRLSAAPEALRSEEPDYKTMYLQLSAQHVRNVEELERELELCRAVTTLCCKKETTPSPLAEKRGG